LQTKSKVTPEEFAGFSEENKDKVCRTRAILAGVRATGKWDDKWKLSFFTIPYLKDTPEPDGGTSELKLVREAFEEYLASR
jgi:hypothetical protein